MSFKLPEVWPFYLLLILVFGTTVGSRDWSYLHIPVGSIPLYITEAVLIASAGILLWRSGVRSLLDWARQSSLELCVAGYLLWGLVRFLVKPDGLEAIRDFALIYYALFAPVTAFVFASRRRLSILAVAFLLGTLAVPLVGVINAVTDQFSDTTTGAHRYLSSAYGMYLAMGLVLVFGAVPLVRDRRKLTAAGGIVSLWLLFGLVLSSHRSIWIALLVGALFVLVLSQPRFIGRLTLFGIVVAGCVGLTSTALSYLGYGDLIRVYLTDRVTQFTRVVGQVSSLEPIQVAEPSWPIKELAPGVESQVPVPTIDDPNIAWRLAAWKGLIEQTLSEAPLWGVGFGPPLRFINHEGHLAEADPHNSVLAVFYRTGIVGLLLFVGINVACFARLWKVSRRASRSSDPESARSAQTSAVLGASLAVVLVTSFFNVALEGPYMGLYYWAIVGLISNHTQVSPS